MNDKEPRTARIDMDKKVSLILIATVMVIAGVAKWTPSEVDNGNLKIHHIREYCFWLKEKGLECPKVEYYRCHVFEGMGAKGCPINDRTE